MAARVRTRFVSTAVCFGVVGALAVAPGAHAKAKGFEFGVAAGDVSSSSAILWAKATKSGDALAQLTAKGGFGSCDIAGASKKEIAAAAKSHDNTVQKKVKDLAADTAYKYRFCMQGGAKSDTGKFTTAPSPKQAKTVSFAISGDQDARPSPGQTTPYWNNFEVWDAIRGQRNDFNVLMGDTIYSDTEIPGYTLADVALTVKQKWRAYKTNLGLKPWAKARGSAAYYGSWDDHEFVNDFARGEDVFPLGVGDVNIDGEELYERGVDAYTDYTPVTFKKKTGIYRSVQWGKNLEVFFLDDRSFRSNTSDYQGACDNPAGSGNPDLAPTAPQSTRNAFSVIVPQLSNPAPPACLASINDPNRTLLGSKQLAKFEQEIESSKATFKVIFNQVPIQQQYANPYDRWEGYAAERTEVLRFLQQNVKNVVFLSTDVHGSMVADARFCTLGDGCPQDSGILDVVTGPIATATYSDEINSVLGSPSGGALIHDAFFKPPPPNGIGLQCAAIDQYSYAQVEASKSQLTVDLLDANDAPVKDTGERDSAATASPCAQVVIPKQ